MSFSKMENCQAKEEKKVDFDWQRFINVGVSVFIVASVMLTFGSSLTKCLCLPIELPNGFMLQPLFRWCFNSTFRLFLPASISDSSSVCWGRKCLWLTFVLLCFIDTYVYFRVRRWRRAEYECKWHCLFLFGWSRCAILCQIKRSHSILSLTDRKAIHMTR